MDSELFRVRLRDDRRKMEVKYRLDAERGWYALLCDNGVHCLAYTSNDLRPPTKNTALAIAELVMRRHIDDSQVAPLEFVEDNEVEVIDDPLTHGMSIDDVLRNRGRRIRGTD